MGTFKRVESVNSNLLRLGDVTPNTVFRLNDNDYVVMDLDEYNWGSGGTIVMDCNDGELTKISDNELVLVGGTVTVTFGGH